MWFRHLTTKTYLRMRTERYLQYYHWFQKQQCFSKTHHAITVGIHDFLIALSLTDPCNFDVKNIPETEKSQIIKICKEYENRVLKTLKTSCRSPEANPHYLRKRFIQVPFLAASSLIVGLSSLGISTFTSFRGELKMDYLENILQFQNLKSTAN